MGAHGASGGDARCGWPTTQSWPRAGVRGSPPRQRTPSLIRLLGAAFWNPEARRQTARRRILAPATNARRDGRLTKATLGDGELKDMGCLGATNRRGWLHARLDWPAARSRARVDARSHSCACAHAASPCPLGAAVWKPEAQHEAERQRT
jgi:hypothetical protein